MDARLENQNEDEFRHKEISDCILNLITNNDYQTPYNIALIGKWGLGKSSILNILEKSLKKENKNYKVILINAWKYESESLKKVFLKEIYEKVSNTKISYIKELETKLNKIFAKVDSENNEKNIISKFMSILPYVIISLMAKNYIYTLKDIIKASYENKIWFAQQAQQEKQQRSGRQRQQKAPGPQLSLHRAVGDPAGAAAEHLLQLPAQRQHAGSGVQPVQGVGDRRLCG